MLGKNKFLAVTMSLMLTAVGSIIWYTQHLTSGASSARRLLSAGRPTQPTRPQRTPSGADPPRQPRAIGVLVNSSSCTIPEYSPWDDTILAVLKKEKPFGGCRQRHPVAFTQKGVTLFKTVDSNKTKAGCTVECCLRSVSRAKEGHTDNGHQFGKRVDCFEGRSSLAVTDEFVQVKCFCEETNATVFEDFRAFIVPKPERASVAPETTKRESMLNVYMVTLDSVSTLNFKRYLPDVEKVLREDFEAVPLLGLNKVGANTFPNMLACLAGITMEQMNQSLRGAPLDNLPLVWKDFSKQGYSTMYTEDTPSMSTFNYLKKGFYVTPTDYYSRPLHLAIAKSKFIKSGSTFCINERHQLDLQLQWLEDFIAQPGAAPQFALVFSNSLSHAGPLGYVKPMQSGLYQFLQQYRRSERYNSSIMFFFSDHGMRFGPIMRQDLGGYESRLPFFYVILPPWYATRHPDRVANLRANSHRLTTFFDVHATLRDILQDAGMSASDLPLLHNPAISLFKPVPRERTCEDAGIAPHWCVCRARRPLPPGGAVVWRAATAVARHINTTLLRKVQRLCAELQPKRVTAAFHTMSDAGGRVKDTSYRRQAFEELVVQLVATPGGGEFEATVRCWRGVPPTQSSSTAPPPTSPYNDTIESLCRPEHVMTVLDVSRLSLYRGQSECVTNPDERRYCFCKNRL